MRVGSVVLRRQPLCGPPAQLLRSAKARTLEVLEEAVAQALASVTAHNAAAWFRHCGYPIHQL